MINNPMEKNLTWNPIFPAPYESIWSILHKVVVLNRLPIKQLASMIGYETATGRRAQVSFLSTNWIDIHRLSRLLQVDEVRIQSGTWEAMGIRQPAGTISSMRQCPQCAELNYHTVLFNIDSISHCPIHNCRLTEACLGCGTQSTFALSKQGHPTGCTRCRLIPSTLPQLMNPIQTELFREQIGALGNQLVSWWKLAGEEFADRDILLGDLLRAGDVDNARIGNRAWQLQQSLASSAKVNLQWKFKFNPESVRYSTFPNCLDADAKVANTEPECKAPGDNVSSGYRSVRRQIFKRYISSHKRCYLALTKLTPDEQHMLDGEHVCPVAFAYVIWRMGSENFVRIAGLNTSRSEKPIFRLAGLSQHQSLSEAVRVRCAYFTFFGILRSIKLLLGRRNFRVQRYDNYANTLFHFGFEKKTPETNVVKRIAILYPYMTVTDATEVQRCVTKSHPAVNLIDASWGTLARPVRYESDDGGGESDILFQVRHLDHNMARPGFTYLSV
jgi:hypothetical protein